MTFAALLPGLRIVLGLSLLGYAAYAVVAVLAARHWHRSRLPLDPDWTPAVSLLKPLRGVDAELYENCASYCRQDYPPDRMQIVFGALDPADPALEVARRLQAEFPHRDIAVVSGEPEWSGGSNRKLRNLGRMLPAAKHDLLVMSDSDIRVTPDYLRRVAAPFAPDYRQKIAATPAARLPVPRDAPPNAPPERPVGVVTCPYRAANARNFPAMLEALGMGADFIPSMMVARLREGVSFAVGQTIAMPQRVLAEIGGFEAFADELADDYCLGNRACKAGYEVVLSDYVVDDVLGAEEFGAMWARRVRWGRTNRALRPAGYAGSALIHGTALATLFFLTVGFSPLAFASVAVLALRLATALTIARLYTQDSAVTRWWWLLPVSDLFSFAIFIVSYCGNRILWRGEQFRLLPGGKMIHLATKPPRKSPR